MDIRVRSRADSKWRLIFLLLAGVYFAINLALPLIPIGGVLKSYVIQPALWILVIVVTLKLPGYRAGGRLRTKSAIIQAALMFGFLQVFFYAIGGFFSGFGKNPSSFTPMGILQNLVLVCAMLAGMELSRAWLVNHLGKHTFLSLAFVSFLYTLLGIPLTQITGLKMDVGTLSFLSATVVPGLMENLLASVLALLAGPLASIAYRGMLQVFWWFCPILPNLSWAFKGILGAAVPIIGLVVVWNYYVSQTQRSKAKQSSGGLQAGWIVTAVLSVALVWFAMGLFPIHPVLVASGSMSPTMDTGDVVLISKTPGDKVKVGDVIEFRKQEGVTIINIMHRIISIQEKEGARSIITKGDANDSADSDPVLPANVVGKVVFTIRKIGWISVIMKSSLQ